jgi:hypothetical protein
MNLFIKIYSVLFAIFILNTLVSFFYPLAFLPYGIGDFFAYEALFIFVTLPLIFIYGVYYYLSHRKSSTK